MNIITTLPVTPTATAIINATQAQKDYTLALAAVSQLVSKTNGTDDAEKLKNALATLGNRISATGLVNVGMPTMSYTLSLQGNITAATALGIQFDLALPTGVTVNVNSADSTVSTSSLTQSGSSMTGAILGAKYSSGE